MNAITSRETLELVKAATAAPDDLIKAYPKSEAATAAKDRLTRLK